MDKNDFINRRSFLKLCGAAALAVTAGCAFPGSPLARQAQDKVRHLTGIAASSSEYIRQIITMDSTNSRTIMWQSEKSQPEARIEYRAPNTPPAAAAASNEGFSDDGVNCWLHTAQLTGLTANTAYEYRIINGKEASSWHSLHTADTSNDSFQALIFPDSQSNDYSGWKQLAQDAAQRCPDAAFFINMGDLVDNGEDHTQWDAWFDAVDGIIDRIPAVPLMGNHETYNQQWKVRLPEAYLQEFSVPDNGSQKFKRYYYSFDYGAVHFTVLNTQWDETEDFIPGLLDEQLTWFRQDMAAAQKKWKVVLLHKDVLQYRIHNRPERQEGISDVGKAFMPLFDAYGVDLVLSAHLHTYRNRGHIRSFQHDSQGPLYILTGVAGNVRYPGLWIDHALDEKTAPQPETDNYLTLDASDDALQITCYLPEGTVIDEARITK